MSTLISLIIPIRFLVPLFKRLHSSFKIKLAILYALAVDIVSDEYLLNFSLHGYSFGSLKINFRNNRQVNYPANLFFLILSDYFV